MIDRAEVERAFARLRARADAPALDDGSFVVERLDDEGRRFLAQSSGGESALIVATAVGPAIPPLRLAGLRVDYGVSCIVVEHGERSDLRAAVITNSASDRTSGDLFATLCASLADALPSTTTDRDVATELDRWARLFWRLSQPAKADLIGLAGELVCIVDASDSSRWIKAWHPRPEDRFDFTFLPSPGVVEVKATSKDRRLHEISLAQVDGPQLDARFFASVRIVDGGTSLAEVVQSIADDLGDDAALLALWNVLTLTCGASLDDALALQIDLELATTSIRYYLASSVPQPVVQRPLPAGVAHVRYSADLDLIEAVDRETVESVCRAGGQSQ